MELLERHPPPDVLFESLPDPVLVIDEERGACAWVNRAAERWLGYSQAELLRLGPADLTAPEDLPRLDAVIAALRTHGVWRGPWHLRRADGRTVSADISATRLEIAGRAVLAGVCRDLAHAPQRAPAQPAPDDDAIRAAHPAPSPLASSPLASAHSAPTPPAPPPPARWPTERPPSRPGDRAEAQPRLSAHIVDSLAVAVIATDLNGTIIAWNEAAERLYGWSAAEVIGQPILEVTPSAASQAEAREIMDQILQGAAWSGEILLRRRDGSVFPALVATTLLHDGEQRLLGVVGASIDISQQVWTEWRRQHRGEASSQVAPAAADRRPSARVCGECDTILTGNRRQRYCSDACRQRAFYRRHAEEQRERARRRREAAPTT